MQICRSLICKNTQFPVKEYENRNSSDINISALHFLHKGPCKILENPGTLQTDVLKICETVPTKNKSIERLFDTISAWVKQWQYYCTFSEFDQLFPTEGAVNLKEEDHFEVTKLESA